VILHSRMFADFILKCEFKVPEGSRSGIYLRASAEGDPLRLGSKCRFITTIRRPAVLSVWPQRGEMLPNLTSGTISKSPLQEPIRARRFSVRERQ
jgi:hypothetical protein